MLINNKNLIKTIKRVDLTNEQETNLNEISNIKNDLNNIKNVKLQNLNTAILGINETLGDKTGLPSGDANIIASINRIDSKTSTGGTGLTSEQEAKLNSIDNKVDKVEGKTLTTNDYTNEEKQTVASLKATVGDTSSGLVKDVKDLKTNGVSQDNINTAIENYLTEHPVQSGATAEQVAQIEANTTAIGDSNSGLIKGVNDLTESLTNVDAVSLNGKTISAPLSKVQYDAIVNKDANTIYLVEDDNAIIGVPDYSLADANKILALNNKGTQLIWKEAESLDSITSPNGTKFRLVVDDEGNLSTEIVAEYGNIIVDPTSCNVNEGGRVTFTVKLDKAPNTNQTITINTDSGYLVPSPSTITFNSDNYDRLQTITLNSSADDNEVDDVVSVTLSCAGIDSETITVNVKEANSYNAPTNPIPASDISLFSNCIDTTNFIFEATDTSAWDALSIGKITVPNNEAQHYKLHFTLLDKNFIDTETETFQTVLNYIIASVSGQPNILIDGGSDSTATTGDRYADKMTAYIKESRVHEELVSEPFYIKSEHVEAALTINSIFGMQFKNTNTGNYLKAQIYIEKL